MSAILGLPPPLIRLMAALMVATVIALVAWALQLMQAANDRQEFSLMLAGCMVCSAAVGLSTVMVLTFTNPESFSVSGQASGLELLPLGAISPDDGTTLDLPWGPITTDGGSTLREGSSPL